MQRGDSTVYRRCRPVEDARFDPDDGPDLTDALVDAISAASDRESTELPPLYDVVDLDALRTLFNSDRVGNGAVYSFDYLDYQVFVGANGWVRVCDRNRPTEPTPVFAGLDGQ